ncbi:hypothetical protein HBI23_166140 [Parastagonospora nodorum]|nr:hypothetical protein HBI12_065710 [Parastagonospora nodorum]KAH5651712.1 hypothetical protein HBI23_166140 [Parastagonospora nodorum]
MAERNRNTDPGAHTPRLAGIVQITVIEGSKSQIFYIARNLLDSKAPGFMSAVDPTKQAERISVEITDVQIEAFDHFVKWLEEETGSSSPMVYICRWLCLAHAYGIPTLREAVIDEIQKRAMSVKRSLDHVPIALFTPPDHVTYVYDNTSVHSPLRAVLVDLFCTAGTGTFTASRHSLGSRLNGGLILSTPSEYLKRYPKHFFVDVMVQKLGAATSEQDSARVVGTNVDQQHTKKELPKKKRKASG